MKTMFAAAPFGSTGLGFYAPPAPPPPMLGQDQTSTPSSSDILDVSKDIESMLAQLPPETLGTYQTQYKNCEDLLNKGGLIGLASGGKCLYDLYDTLKNVIKNKPQPAKPTMPSLPFLAPQSSFPIIPVTLIGLGGIALIYGLTSMG